MKLLSKYNRVNVVATIIVLLLSAVIYYFFIKAALIHQLDKSLIAEEKEVNDYVAENNRLPETSITKDEQEVYALANNNVERKFSSIKFHISNQRHENVHFRQLEFPVTLNGQMYKADVRKSQAEAEHLVQLILKITLIIVVILLVTLFLINRFILNKLWKPFNNTLEQIKQFNVSAEDGLHLEQTNIDEFVELNAVVSLMTKKARDDYNEIKNFTENASHEIQTPLAIIKSKLELLSQSERLQEDQMDTIQVISETASRLSKLNQSLILLAKIDNRQFSNSEEVNISSLLLRHLDNYEELFKARRIKLLTKIESDIKLLINETLADILITNLLTNSIKHNVEEGTVDINLSKDHLTMANSGGVLSEEPGSFFQRFKKESASNDSLGLGLSIVKKISDTYGFVTVYDYSNGIHTITINFK